jgi:hypothetical protein
MDSNPRSPLEDSIFSRPLRNPATTKRPGSQNRILTARARRADRIAVCVDIEACDRALIVDAADGRRGRIRGRPAPEINKQSCELAHTPQPNAVVHLTQRTSRGLLFKREGHRAGRF